MYGQAWVCIVKWFVTYWLERSSRDQPSIRTEPSNTVEERINSRTPHMVGYVTCSVDEPYVAKITCLSKTSIMQGSVIFIPKLHCILVSLLAAGQCIYPHPALFLGMHIAISHNHV